MDYQTWKREIYEPRMNELAEIRKKALAEIDALVMEAGKRYETELQQSRQGGDGHTKS